MLKPTIDSARTVQNSAKNRAPRNDADPPKDPSRKVTGELKGDITVEKVEGNEDARAVTAGKEYSPYHEFGTRFMKARPFMKPAVDENVEIIQQYYEEHIQRELRKAVN